MEAYFTFKVHTGLGTWTREGRHRGRNGAMPCLTRGPWLIGLHICNQLVSPAFWMLLTATFDLCSAILFI